MSEQTTGAAPAAPASPAAPAAPAPTPTPAAPAPAATPDVDPFDSGETQFSRSYVEKLRQEAAGHRTKAARFEAMKDLEDGELETWSRVAQAWKTDPSTAADQLEAEIKAFRDSQTEKVEEGEKPLTRSEYDKLEADRQGKADEAKAVESIYAQAKELGYSKDGDDAWMHRLLLQTAHGETEGDLDKAHELIQGRVQSIKDVALGKKQAQAGPRPATSSGSAPSQAKEHDGTWGSARERLEARMRATTDKAVQGI